MLHAVTVSYCGRPVRTDTVVARLDAADPGTWQDHPLVWSCPILARHWADTIAAELGPRYEVHLTERTRS